MARPATKLVAVTAAVVVVAMALLATGGDAFVVNPAAVKQAFLHRSRFAAAPNADSSEESSAEGGEAEESSEVTKAPSDEQAVPPDDGFVAPTGTGTGSGADGSTSTGTASFADQIQGLTGKFAFPNTATGTGPDSKPLPRPRRFRVAGAVYAVLDICEPRALPDGFGLAPDTDETKAAMYKATTRKRRRPLPSFAAVAGGKAYELSNPGQPVASASYTVDENQLYSSSTPCGGEKEPFGRFLLLTKNFAQSDTPDPAAVQASSLPTIGDALVSPDQAASTQDDSTKTAVVHDCSYLNPCGAASQDDEQGSASE